MSIYKKTYCFQSYRIIQYIQKHPIANTNYLASHKSMIQEYLFVIIYLQHLLPNSYKKKNISERFSLFFR